MKGISSKVTRAIPSIGTMLCVDNSGAKVVLLITVLRRGSVHRRYPAGGVGDLVQVTVKRGTPECGARSTMLSVSYTHLTLPTICSV